MPSRPKPRFSLSRSSRIIVAHSVSVRNRFSHPMNMPSDNPTPYALQPPGAVPTPVVVTAIVPARNEEAVIAASIETLSRQPEIAQILVVNDQSSDATAELVRNLVKEIPDLRLLETGGLPDGWVGKNYALWVGVQQATSPWLLFTDADAAHAPNSVARGLQIARERQAALVSFSPEQITRSWDEKALIPFVYFGLEKESLSLDGRNPLGGVSRSRSHFALDSVSFDPPGPEVSLLVVPRNSVPDRSPDHLWSRSWPQPLPVFVHLLLRTGGLSLCG